MPELADFQAAEDHRIIRELMQGRRRQGLTVEQVAERIGECPLRTQQFEDGEWDPPLSFLRRYSVAIGLRVMHQIVDIPDAPDLSSGSWQQSRWDDPNGDR